MKPLVSLCIPTNGVSEWVFSVLASIDAQGIENSQFEIVITDNGHNDEFKQKMGTYLTTHTNVVYVETEALPFLNEIESYKRASGTLIKFVNHRTRLVPGALRRLIDFAEAFQNSKPIVYFSNGVLQLTKEPHYFDTFDQFVKNLSYFSSWSTGMAIWNEDFERLTEDISEYNELFPHTTVLFSERKRDQYIIDNSVVFDEIPQGNRPKGGYDLFFAFGIEYPWIVCNLLRDKCITNDTYRTVVNANLTFVASLCFSYIIRRRYCSYDLSGYDNMFGVFYSKAQIRKRIIKYCFGVIMKKLFGKRKQY